MTQQLAPERPEQITAGLVAANPTGLVAAAAAVRGAAVAAAGLILATGLATIVWAMTPASGDDVAVAMRGGVVAFAAANLMPVGIGGVTLSLPPLMFTLVLVALLAAAARHGRFLPEGRYQETVSVLITALVYGVIVAATTRGFGPPGAVGPQWVWTAPAIAVAVTGGAMLQPGSAWHKWCVAALPGWLRVSVRCGGVGLGVLLAGGGLAVTVGLISHFGDAVSVAALAAPSWMDGFGLALLGVAYLPNAVIAGAGYATGVGFEIGAGTYSPFSTVPVDLPAIPLLAAVPDAAGRSWMGLIFLCVPVAAGYLIARVTIKRLSTRADRTLAAGVGALFTGGLLAAAVAIARGGVGDGRWSTMGSPPLLIAAAVTVEVGVIAVALAGLTGSRTVPWRASAPGTAAVFDAHLEASEGLVTAEPKAVRTGKKSRRSRKAAQESAMSEDRPAKKGRRPTRRGRSKAPGAADTALLTTTVAASSTDAAIPAKDGVSAESSTAQGPGSAQHGSAADGHTGDLTANGLDVSAESGRLPDRAAADPLLTDASADRSAAVSGAQPDSRHIDAPPVDASQVDDSDAPPLSLAGASAPADRTATVGTTPDRTSADSSVDAHPVRQEGAVEEASTQEATN